MEEIWKDIKNYEGLYQVSNLGRVKSLNFHRTGKERILKLFKKRNYLQVCLSKNSKHKYYSVHRLVATTFIHNPNGYLVINHRDEDPFNNCVNNLEFCTQKYNINYGNRNKKCALAQPYRKRIKCIDLETNEEKNYSSIHEASRQMNLRHECIWQSIYKYKSPYKNRYIFSEIENGEEN